MCKNSSKGVQLLKFISLEIVLFYLNIFCFKFFILIIQDCYRSKEFIILVKVFN